LHEQRQRHRPKRERHPNRCPSSLKRLRSPNAMTPTEKYAHFLQKSVVRGKIVKVDYFREQGLGLFFDKLQAQGWLELFINKGCSVPDLVVFYAN